MCWAILWQIQIFTQCAQVCAGLSFDRSGYSNYRMGGKSALSGNRDLSHFILWNRIMAKQSWSVQYQPATFLGSTKMNNTRGKESSTTPIPLFCIAYLVQYILKCGAHNTSFWAFTGPGAQNPFTKTCGMQDKAQGKTSCQCLTFRQAVQLRDILSDLETCLTQELPRRLLQDCMQALSYFVKTCSELECTYYHVDLLICFHARCCCSCVCIIMRRESSLQSDFCNHFQVGGSFRSLSWNFSCQESNGTLLFLLQRAFPNTELPSFQLAPSWQSSGSNSRVGISLDIRLLIGPNGPGDPLTLLQLEAKWWPELAGFISYALQMLKSQCECERGEKKTKPFRW